MMKKILIICSVLILTGCGKKNFSKQYEEMQIGIIDSYQLDLRIYAAENKQIKIDNYKNEEYKIEFNDNIYYILNNTLYKEKITEENGVEEINYEKSDDKVFTDTNIILESLNNIKSRKEISNDIDGIDLKVYEVKLKDKYIKSLLKKLDLAENYKSINTKIYLENDKIYKIVYEIDNIKISATFFRVNNIQKLNINFE